MLPDGTVNWAVQYVDSTISSIDVFTSLFLESGILYPISVHRYSTSYTLDLVSKVDASTGAVSWTYAEIYGTGYYIVYMFQDFSPASGAFHLCNNSNSDHELEHVYYTLDGSGLPSDHHYYVHYEYIGGLYTGIRCAGAYVTADGSAGVVAYNKVYAGSFSKQCVVV
jgi:hypothetical protein